MSMLPIFVNLAGRNCCWWVQETLRSTRWQPAGRQCKLRIIAPEAREEIKRLALEGRLEWIERAFDETDLDGNFLVIAATDVPEVNALFIVLHQAQHSLHSVDDIPNCDFFFGSV